MAVARGFAPSDEARVDLAPGETREVALALRPGRRLAGRVTDARTSRGIGGARVELEGDLAGDADEAVAVRGQAMTSADGSFQLDGLAPGLASVFTLAAGYHARVTSRIEIPPTGNPAPLAIALEPLLTGEEPKLVIAGIGAVLVAEGDELVVREAVPGGGAAEVGLVPGDGVLAVDGRAVTDLGFNGAIQLIRGPEGTVVRLRVRRAGGTLDLDVPRRLVRR